MLNQKIISKAKELNFSLIGFAPYQTLEEETKNLKDWLSKDYQAGMNYMERNIEKRGDVKEILADCKSVISLGMNYYTDEHFEKAENTGKVSRYAWGRDYHNVIWEKLDIFLDFVKNIQPDFIAKSYVDTGPVMDKIWAVKSGLGWQGKHSNVINKKNGSWFFIATIFTNFDFNEYSEPIENFCGTCTACIDACPTNAIVEDYVVDSNKCISYLTIENKKAISDEFIGKFDNWIFGCDICQDVCPWNIKFAQQTKVSDFMDIQNKLIHFENIEQMENMEFKTKFHESPVLRTKLKGLKRNAAFLKKRV